MAKSSPFKKKTPPKFIYVLGHKIEVKVVDHLSEDGKDLLGRYNPDKKEIEILKTQSCWQEILFHEVLHCVLDLAGSSEGLTEEKEEIIVRSLTSGLFCFVS